MNFWTVLAVCGLMSSALLVEAKSKTFRELITNKAVGSCVGRCGQSGTDSTKPCQCNLSCQTYGDCCDDFLATCNTCNGRCSTSYNNKWPCQCNVECPSYDNCCADYDALCLGVTTTVKTTPTTTTTTVATTTPESFTCPNDLFGRYPNPNDCHSYYECLAGQEYLMNCPPGLYYNPDLQVCDYLDNVPSCQ
ncbi:proteoglycan 4 [Daphnia magna]|uniref:proteoglycan 4 n=1 Tax=Daphnia magna TaxID=35525 RepID=UPI001E1BB886|nr:proteoglycan 4 [Daphnia magna]